jgi:hypothetical protein
MTTAKQPPKAQAAVAEEPRVAEEPPRTVRLAVWCMYAGALLSVLYLAVSLATAHTLYHLLKNAHPHDSHAVLESAVKGEVVSTVVIWLITIGFWIVMARTNQAGRRWARIVATILCAFSSLNFVEGVLGSDALLSKVVYLPLWLVGVAATVLLWRSETTAYIQAGRD